MQVAISGASGLIGKALSESLRSRGHSVFRLSRSLASNRDDLLAWKPMQGLVQPEAVSGFDAVVHLAGKSIAAGRWTEALRQEIHESRVGPTRVLASQLASLRRPPNRVISASATGFYGSRDGEVLDELAHPGEGFLAKVAAEWERACDPLRNAGVDVLHPRFGMVLDQLGGALKQCLPIFRFGLGGRLGSGEQYWPWISLRDCVRALCFLVEGNGHSDAYNLVAPQQVTNADFTMALGKAIRRPTCVPVPEFALKFALGEMADELLLSSCRARPNRLLADGFEYLDPEIGPFLCRLLGERAE